MDDRLYDHWDHEPNDPGQMVRRCDSRWMQNDAPDYVAATWIVVPDRDHFRPPGWWLGDRYSESDLVGGVSARRRRWALRPSRVGSSRWLGPPRGLFRDLWGCPIARRVVAGSRRVLRGRRFRELAVRPARPPSAAGQGGGDRQLSTSTGVRRIAVLAGGEVIASDGNELRVKRNSVRDHRIGKRTG